VFRFSYYIFFVIAEEYTVYGINNIGAPQPGRFNNDPRRAEWTNVMDADDDEDSGIELVTVNNFQNRNINQLVSYYYPNLYHSNL